MPAGHDLGWQADWVGDVSGSGKSAGTPGRSRQERTYLEAFHKSSSYLADLSYVAEPNTRSNKCSVFGVRLFGSFCRTLFHSL
jgi:hypothetical protein